MEEKIQYYLRLAFEQGIEKAIKEIKKTEKPFLVDLFHDKLIEEINKKKQEIEEN